MQTDYLLASPQHLFRAYTLLLAAQRATEAHRIAAEDLVPEALVRGDYPLVRRLLEPFLLSSSLSPEPTAAPTGVDGEPNLDGFVSGWKHGGGQTYLLFLSQPDHPHLLARAMQAVQALSKRVKESSRLRSKKLLRLAVAEMEGRLTVLAKANTASKVRSSSLALRPFLECLAEGHSRLIDRFRHVLTLHHKQHRPSSELSRLF